MTESVNFGFETVSPEEKTTRVRGVFDSVAQNYDLMNDLMSAGIHRLWKDEMVLDLPMIANANVLDVAGGTGDIAMRILKKYPYLSPTITVCDLTPAMVTVGRDRALNEGILQGINWTSGNAEALPFADESMDIYTIAFGLRNVTHIDKALCEAYRVLKPGGTFVCLEFNKVNNAPLQAVYDWYSFTVLPKIGKHVAKDEPSYQYLVESIRRFPDQEELTAKLKEAKFDTVRWKNLLCGVSCIHTAIK
jgi:demethylmenaquinone methyltransferase / 2-methoxy-6-polyprenyl-1,4-benzoquinol methylase